MVVYMFPNMVAYMSPNMIAYMFYRRCQNALQVSPCCWSGSGGKSNKTNLPKEHDSLAITQFRPIFSKRRGQGILRSHDQQYRQVLDVEQVH